MRLRPSAGEEGNSGPRRRGAGYRLSDSDRASPRRQKEASNDVIHVERTGAARHGGGRGDLRRPDHPAAARQLRRSPSRPQPCQWTGGGTLLSVLEAAGISLRSHPLRPAQPRLEPPVGAATSEHRHLRRGPGTRPARGRTPLRREARRRRIPFGVGAGGAQPGIPGAGFRGARSVRSTPVPAERGSPGGRSAVAAPAYPGPVPPGSLRDARGVRGGLPPAVDVRAGGAGSPGAGEPGTASYRGERRRRTGRGADTNFAARASGKLTRFSTLSPTVWNRSCRVSPAP